MKSKEKGKIIIGIAIIIVLAIILIIYNVQKQVVYANSETKDVEIIKVSNAEKVDIEEIIKKNSQEDKEQIIVEKVNIEYITQYKNNNELPKGTMQVVQEGRTGKQQVTIKRTIDENGEIHDEELSSIITIGAVNKIVEVGTSTTKVAYKISKGSEIYVTSDRAEIKVENNEQSDKITTVVKNAEFKVLQIQDDWFKINIDGQVGWIKAQNVASVYSNPNYKTENNYTSNGIVPCSFDMALNSPSGLSLEQFKKVLTDSKDVNGIFSNNAEYFYYIERQYNINGIFVAAIGIHESGWGNSSIAKNKKNLFGYRAYDRSPYNSASTFSTYSEGIDLIARVLVKYYLNPKGTAIYNGETAVGTYYNGNNVSAVNQKYATDKGWANKVYSYMEYLYKKL